MEEAKKRERDLLRKAKEIADKREEYGLEQDMEWKIEWNGKMEWNAKWQYLMAYRIKEKCYMRKGMKWRIVCSIV